jgi:hypothetical protein
MSTLAVAGTNTTGSAWLTMILPLGFLVLVLWLWWRSMHDGGEATWEGGTHAVLLDGSGEAPNVDPPAGKGGSGKSRVMLPVVPGVVLLPWALAVALAVVAIVLWWHESRRAQG